jgi:diacylglycerol kinase (ATP)
LKATLFVNPLAGRGKCHRRHPEVAKTLRDAGVECDVVVSQYPGHITQVSSDVAARGEDTVIVCGGDGTVNEVINGVAGTQTAVGIVPLGSANHLATSVEIGKDIGAACRIIRQRHTEAIDVVRINDDKLFAGVGCVGFDSEVAAFASSRRKEKSYPFLLQLFGGMLKFFSYHPKTVELRFNGDRFFGKVFLVAFGDSRSWTRTVLASDAAGTPEPCLSVSVVRPMSKWRLISRFLSISKKVNPNNKGVTIHQTHSVHVQSLGPMDLYVDGDFMTKTPFRLELMPKYVQLIVNPSSSSPSFH